MFSFPVPGLDYKIDSFYNYRRLETLVSIHQISVFPKNKISEYITEIVGLGRKSFFKT